MGPTTVAPELEPRPRATAFKAARILFVLLIFSLPFMRYGREFGGLQALPTDLLYLLCAAAFSLALLRGETRLRWHRFFWVIAAYFAAMAASALAAEYPARSALKLATQAYLLSLPVLAYNLILGLGDLRRVVVWWLAAAGIVGLVGAITLLLFYAGVDPARLTFSLHEQGTLPPGDYPRLHATFRHPALLGNYLTVSLMLLLAARRLDWVSAPAFALLLVLGGATAAFSLTPGLGGIVLGVGLWWWLSQREFAPILAGLALAAGIAGAMLFVLVATVTPFLHPTAPFLIPVPGLEQPLAPSVRMLTWIESARNWLESPLLGRGIGDTGLSVHYVGPSGRHYVQTDAHNGFLNIAVQCGLVGLAAMLVLIWQAARETRPLAFDGTAFSTLRVALGIAWLNAFAYQGLTGSYEDVRWLWIALGLLLAVNRLIERDTESANETAEGRTQSPTISP